jgi:hypothetical protein
MLVLTFYLQSWSVAGDMFERFHWRQSKNREELTNFLVSYNGSVTAVRINYGWHKDEVDFLNRQEVFKNYLEEILAVVDIEKFDKPTGMESIFMTNP